MFWTTKILLMLIAEIFSIFLLLLIKRLTLTILNFSADDIIWFNSKVKLNCFMKMICSRTTNWMIDLKSFKKNILCIRSSRRRCLDIKIEISCNKFQFFIFIFLFNDIENNQWFLTSIKLISSHEKRILEIFSKDIWITNRQI